MFRSRQIYWAIRRSLSVGVACFLLANALMFGFMHAPVALANTATATDANTGQSFIPLIICTANGIKTISVSPELATGSTTSPHSSNAYEGFQCAICGLGNHAVGLPVDPEMPMILRVRLSNSVTALHITARLHDFCAIAASPRAPPFPV
ncbi:DUF2946 family protein [Thalassospira alkalitolerans]|uniref:DUF2946 family protein n=1 Tax=Thalassospira alkalitolerans TaxID=1293890 RepID=UPI001FE9C8C4|nr:DUF2946 family protein [Thalassospira alkalitolerans]